MNVSFSCLFSRYNTASWLVGFLAYSVALLINCNCSATQTVLQPVPEKDTIYVTGTNGGILRFDTEGMDIFSPQNGHIDMVFHVDGRIFTIRNNEIMHISVDGDAEIYATGVLTNSYGMAIDTEGNFYVANSSDCSRLDYVDRNCQIL